MKPRLANFVVCPARAGGAQFDTARGARTVPRPQPVDGKGNSAISNALLPARPLRSGTGRAPSRAACRTRAGGVASLGLGVFWCLLFGVGCLPSRAADTNAVLAAWFASQTNLQTWTADFVQTRSLKTLTQPLVTPGRIAFAIPSQFRWELGRPARTIAVRQRDEMYVIYPLLKRAERYPMGEQAPGEWRDMLSLLDSGFPRDRAEFDTRFRILALTESNGGWRFTMQPASTFARKLVREIRVSLAANTFELTSNEMIFADGSSMRNDYTNAVLNPLLPEDTFRWQPEPGYKVTEPMKR